MGITGNLKTMELAELLQWLSQGQKTGTLVVVDRRVAKQIYFRKGKIISAASSDPKEYLGHFLVRQGYIDEQQLATAISRQEAEKALLGRILVDMELISEGDLDDMLRRKAEEGIYDLFTWEEGEFRFLDGELPKYDMVPISLDVTGIVLEATRRLDELQRIRSLIPSRLAVPVIVTDDWEALVGREELDEGQRRILAGVNDDRTIEEIALEAHASDYYVSEVLYPLVHGGYLKVVRPRYGGEETGPRVAPEELSAGSLLKKGLQYLEEDRLAEALRHLDAAASLAPDDARIRKTKADAEASIRRRLEKEGVVPSAVPRLTRSLEELSREAVSPKAGFLLSRINGTYDLGSILKISPMSQLEAMMVVQELVAAGHVRLGG
jgi:hypothetical protein